MNELIPESIPLDATRIQLLIRALEEAYGYTPTAEEGEQPPAIRLDPSALVRDIANAEWMIEKLRNLVPADAGADGEPLALIRPRTDAADSDTL